MIPFKINSFDSVSSTNDIARDYLSQHDNVHGHIFMAKAQTAGRGRHARVWDSASGNLFATLILQPSCDLGKAAQLSVVMAIAIGETLLEILPNNAHLTYKWPNDILINGQKICGILLEAETKTDHSLKGLITGFGINVTSFPAEAIWPATSLKEHDVMITPEALLEKITVKVDFFYKNWTEQGLTQMRRLWLERAYNIDKPMTVCINNEKITGNLKDLSAEGALLLDHDGKLITITSGEVYFKD